MMGSSWKRAGILMGVGVSFVLSLMVLVTEAADTNHTITIMPYEPITFTPTPTVDPVRRIAETRVFETRLQPLSFSFPPLFLNDPHDGKMEVGAPSEVIFVPDSEDGPEVIADFVEKLGEIVGGENNADYVKHWTHLLRSARCTDPISYEDLGVTDGDPIYPDFYMPGDPVEWEKIVLKMLAAQAEEIGPGARVKIIAVGNGALAVMKFLSLAFGEGSGNAGVDRCLRRVDRFIIVESDLLPFLDGAKWSEWASDCSRRVLSKEAFAIDFRLVYREAPPRAKSARSSGFVDAASASGGLAIHPINRKHLVPAMIADRNIRKDPYDPKDWRRGTVHLKMVERLNETHGDPALVRGAIEELFDAPQAVIYRYEGGYNFEPGRDPNLDASKIMAGNFPSNGSQMFPLDYETMDLAPLVVFDDRRKRMIPTDNVYVENNLEGVAGILRDYSPEHVRSLELSINGGSWLEFENPVSDGYFSCDFDRIKESICELRFKTVNWAGRENIQRVSVWSDDDLASLYLAPRWKRAFRWESWMKEKPAFVMNLPVTWGPNTLKEYETEGGLLKVEEIAVSNGQGPAIRFSEGRADEISSIVFRKSDVANGTVAEIALDLPRMLRCGSAIPSGRYIVSIRARSCLMENARTSVFGFTLDNEAPDVGWLNVRPWDCAGVMEPAAFNPYQGKLGDLTPSPWIMTYTTKDELSVIANDIHFDVIKGFSSAPGPILFQSHGMNVLKWSAPKMGRGEEIVEVLRVSVKDAAGNGCSNSVTVKWDTLAPVIEMMSIRTRRSTKREIGTCVISKDDPSLSVEYHLGRSKDSKREPEGAVVRAKITSLRGQRWTFDHRSRPGDGRMVIDLTKGAGADIPDGECTLQLEACDGAANVGVSETTTLVFKREE